MFFTRANDNVELRALVDDSPLIARAVANTPNAQTRFWPGVTARDWLERRVRGQRIKNFTVRRRALNVCAMTQKDCAKQGPESFRNWMGTEDVAFMTKARVISEDTTPHEVVAV